MVEDISRGQRTKKCEVVGCNDWGRVLAKIGNIEIAYCPKHRKKYGERIIEALINSAFNYKLSNFLSIVKDDIFFSEQILDEESARRLKEYIILKTEELEKILDYAEENDAKYQIKEEIN